MDTTEEWNRETSSHHSPLAMAGFLTSACLKYNRSSEQEEAACENSSCLMSYQYSNMESSCNNKERRHVKASQNFHGLQLTMVALLGILIQNDICLALSPSASTKTSAQQSQIPLQQLRRVSTAGSSPLFAGQPRRAKLQRNGVRSGESSSTALNMVLTTPEAIIEQASTVSLLDDLIDESVRTSPRRPIMIQFDPYSGWVSLLSFVWCN